LRMLRRLCAGLLCCCLAATGAAWADGGDEQGSRCGHLSNDLDLALKGSQAKDSQIRALETEIARLNDSRVKDQQIRALETEIARLTKEPHTTGPIARLATQQLLAPRGPSFEVRGKTSQQAQGRAQDVEAAYSSLLQQDLGDTQREQNSVQTLGFKDAPAKEVEISKVPAFFRLGFQSALQHCSTLNKEAVKSDASPSTDAVNEIASLKARLRDAKLASATGAPTDPATAAPAQTEKDETAIDRISHSDKGSQADPRSLDAVSALIHDTFQMHANGTCPTSATGCKQPHPNNEQHCMRWKPGKITAQCSTLIRRWSDLTQRGPLPWCERTDFNKRSTKPTCMPDEPKPCNDGFYTVADNTGRMTTYHIMKIMMEYIIPAVHMLGCPGTVDLEAGGSVFEPGCCRTDVMDMLDWFKPCIYMSGKKLRAYASGGWAYLDILKNDDNLPPTCKCVQSHLHVAERLKKKFTPMATYKKDFPLSELPAFLQKCNSSIAGSGQRLGEGFGRRRKTQGTPNAAAAPGTPMKNLGGKCWTQCGKGDGHCPQHCGSALCCRKGYKGNGCDGKMGGALWHMCFDPKATFAAQLKGSAKQGATQGAKLAKKAANVRPVSSECLAIKEAHVCTSSKHKCVWCGGNIKFSKCRPKKDFASYTKCATSIKQKLLKFVKDKVPVLTFYIDVLQKRLPGLVEACKAKDFQFMSFKCMHRLFIDPQPRLLVQSLITAFRNHMIQQYMPYSTCAQECLCKGMINPMMESAEYKTQVISPASKNPGPRFWVPNFIMPYQSHWTSLFPGPPIQDAEGNLVRGPTKFEGWLTRNGTSKGASKKKMDAGGLQLMIHHLSIPKAAPSNVLPWQNPTDPVSMGDTWLIVKRVKRAEPDVTLCEAELGTSFGVCASCCCSGGAVTQAMVTRLSISVTPDGYCKPWFAMVDTVYRTAVMSVRLLMTAPTLLGCK